MAALTIATLKEVLDISDTTDDTYLTNLISRAQDRCEKILGRPIEAASYTEYLSGDGTKWLNLRYGPVQGVSAVDLLTYDSAGVEQTSALTVNVDYFIWGLATRGWKRPGYLEHIGAGWSSGSRNYKVAYTAGFSDPLAPMPESIKQAIIHACTWWKNKRRDAATGSRDIGQGAIGGFRDEEELDRDLWRMLDAFIDVRVA